MGCNRCGGLKVAERFYGTDSTVAAWACSGFRCLNCGAIWFEGFHGRTVRPDDRPRPVEKRNGMSTRHMRR